jgi:DNA-binding transcriptional MerR regulator
LDKSPDAFRTISEAADELDLPQHVLRFWETRFSTIKPMKRGGGRRYYRPEDVQLLRGIRHLLYDRGFTIKGVQRILKDQGVRYVIAVGEGRTPDPVIAEIVNTAPAGEESTSAPSPDASAQVLPRLLGRPRGAAGLGKADREKLTEVLRDLLDCKRLLDRAREG